MRQSETLTELFSALSLAQGEIEDAKKDSTNPHFKSKYADLASVRAAIRDPFAKHGLAISQWPRTSDKAVEVETVLSHKSGQFIAETLSCPLAAMTAQAIGSALTYLRRYSMMAVSGIAPDDDDGNEATRPTQFATGKDGDKWSGKEGANAREEEFESRKYYVSQSKARLSKIESVTALQTWWKDQKSIMEDMFDGTDDPFYADLKGYYAEHGKALRAKETKADSLAAKIGDDLPDSMRAA